MCCTCHAMHMSCHTHMLGALFLVPYWHTMYDPPFIPHHADKHDHWKLIGVIILTHHVPTHPYSTHSTPCTFALLGDAPAAGIGAVRQSPQGAPQV